MTPERAKLLAELLEEVAEKDSGFIPDPAWHAFHKVVAPPYCELCVVRKNNTGWQLLLGRVRPNDQDFPGDPWEIMGGMWKPAYGSREAICSAIAEREMGIRVLDIREVGTFKWSNLRGHGMSHVCVARIDPSGPVVQETDRKRFFDWDKLPAPLALYHPEFIAAVTAFLESGQYSNT